MPTGIYHSPQEAVIKPEGDILQVKIISPKKMIFLGLALAVTSSNSAGRFDILPQHANFITLVKNKPIEILDRNNQKVSYSFNIAIVLAINNTVNIYADIGTPEELHQHQK